MMKWFRSASLMIYGMVLLAMVVGGLLATLMFGWVAGSEFCPQTFETRTFEYFQIPLLRVQVTGVSRDAPQKVAPVLTTKNWIRPDLQAPRRWDLLSGGVSSWTAEPGDASILTAYLDREGRQNPWIQWSTDHPTLAAELWPLVADAARLNAYVLLPDLFDAAKEYSDRPAPEFRLRLRAAVADGLKLYGEDLVQLGRAPEAEQVLTRADELRTEVGGRY